ncbi:MAG: type II toxin-antitoxin system VapB family antitoxin [Eggerthellaceae bacterium]|nr:type II toxin-antitoxin system VapB family antitoxin [Eggerthellaceae bacterium]
MEIAKVFTNGASQAVRLPKSCRFSEDEVYVKKLGEVVYLFPKSDVWETFLNGINSFSDDFMADGRDQGTEQVRTPL